MKVAPAQGMRPESPQVLARYREVLDEGLRVAVAGTDTEPLTMLQYHMGWVSQEGRPANGSPGKCLRPALCLLCCDAVGGDVAHALPAAVALELVHNFSLIHDDIQDGDRERRHRPALWALWGKPRALMAGNIMRILADRTVLALNSRGVSHVRAIETARILTARYLEMIEGQFLDLSYEGRTDVAVAEYMEMVSKKTGALLEAATHIGAYLGTTELERVEALRSCGRLLGLAFQIRDDVLGIWGDEAVTGKATGADIRRKKKSFPVVFAMQHAEGEEQARLLEVYSRPSLGESEVAQVLEALERVKAREYAQQQAEELCAQALSWARHARLLGWAYKELEELACFMLERQH